MSKFGLDAPIGRKVTLGRNRIPPVSRVLRRFIRCGSLELKYADPRGRGPFRSWRMNSAMPQPRTVKETSRIRACCWIARY